MKEFADDNHKFNKVIQTGRKHWEKSRNCSIRVISPFPTMFSKDCRHVKTKACFQKELIPDHVRKWTFENIVRERANAGNQISNVSKLRKIWRAIDWLIDWLIGALHHLKHYFCHITVTAHIIHHVFPAFHQC